MTPFDDLVYLRLFEGCNLFCQHCFIPQNPKKMHASQMETLHQILQPHIAPGSRVLLQWHGGEPTALGPALLRSYITTIHTQKEYHWAHSIQTNLINYHEHRTEWAELYHAFFEHQVGVSWDSSIRFFKKDCSTESQQQYTQQFFTNLDYLIEDGLEPRLIVTATKQLFLDFPDPFVFFEKWSDIGVYDIHLERITKTGYAFQNWDTLGLNNAEYESLMLKWFKAYTLWSTQRQEHGERYIAVSPFVTIQKSVSFLNQAPFHGGLLQQDDLGSGCLSGKCDTHFHTVDSGGYKSGCTALTGEVDNSSKKINTIFWAPSKKKYQEQRAERQKACQECPFLSICSSGCLTTERWDDSGSCSGAFKLFQWQQSTL